MGKGRGRGRGRGSGVQSPNHQQQRPGGAPSINHSNESIPSINLSAMSLSSSPSSEGTLSSKASSTKLSYGGSSLGHNLKQYEPPSVGSVDEKRKVCGTVGRPIQLRANHYPMDINIPNGNIYHYDVAFTLPNNREVKKSQKALLTRVIERVKELHKDTLGNPYSIVFDGFKNLYSCRELFPGTFDCKVEIMEGEDSPRKLEIEIKIKRVGQGLPVNDLVAEYVRTGKTSTRTNDSLQVLNIILGMTPLLHYECVQRNHFNPSPTNQGSIIDIGHGKSLWVGTFQSVRLGWKPMLNVDMANRPAYEQQPIIDFVLATLTLPRGQKPNLNNLKNIQSRDKSKIDRELKQLKIRFTRPDGEKREYRVNKLVDSAERQKVLLKDGPKMTIKDYFLKQYNYVLKHPGIPCLHVGSLQGTIYIPMELCQLKKQLAPASKVLGEEESAEMIRKTAMPPDVREKRIQRNMAELNNYFKTDPYAKSFGLKISEEMVRVTGRVLESPSLKYKIEGKDIEFKHSPGKWNMGFEREPKKYMFISSVPLVSWGVLDLAGCSDSDQELFTNSLYEEAKVRGHRIDFPVYGKADFGNLDDVEKTFRKMCGHIQTKNNTKPQLIMIIVPRKGNVYPCIKFLGDAVLNVPTQFVMKKNFVGKPQVGLSSQTLHNICLKINAKTGGTNHGLFVRPPVMKKPVMILGADVTHSSPADSKRKPSIAAMVASCNPEASQYLCEVRVQREGQIVEEIEKTEEMVYNLLKKFEERTRQKPHKIIYYRDGVSEGQFISVLNHELSSIRKACSRLNHDYKPSVTFLVAQKRHKTRFFTTNPKDGFGKMKNIPPGTVVDTVVTHPTEYDFFLASHEGIQGTTKPTHYHLLWDDSDFTADELQTLTYNLCHLYSRCERSVSYPAPTYYSHLAAARAREHHNALLMRVHFSAKIPKEDLRKIEQLTLLNYFI